MSGVDFGDLESGAEGALRSRDVIGDDLVNFGDGESFWCRVSIRERSSGWADGCPAAVRTGNSFAAVPRNRGAAFSTCMRQLNSGDGAVALDEVNNRTPGLDVRVEVDAGVTRGNAADGLNAGGFGHDERGAADGAATEMHEMPLTDVSIVGGI